MKNKGYTIIEAVIAMFLVVVMVGAVFSALMTGRRAIVNSSEKEEVFYTMQSLYGLIKDCNRNPNCILAGFEECRDNNDLRGCQELFTFAFNNVCRSADDDGKSALNFQISALGGASNNGAKFFEPGEFGSGKETDLSPLFATLDINSFCDE